MSDIDFDELDKAVNSLMGSAAVPKENVNTQSTLSIGSTLQPDQKPEYDALGKAVEGISNESLVNGASQSATDNQSVEGDTARVIKLDQEKLDAAKRAGIMPTVPEKPAATAVKRPSSGRFMDVVHPSADMRSAPAPDSLSQPIGPVPPKASQPVSPVAPVARSTPVSTSPANATELVSASPFLTDAKVEKRPLGGEPPTGGPVVAENSSAGQGQQNDLIGVEGENTSEGAMGDQQQTLNAEDFSSETDNQELQLQNIESSFDSGASDTTIRSLESEDTGNMPHDTTPKPVVSAAQPLAHPAKQKSGWGVVIIIAVIIVLSIVVAGAAYFFVIKS